MNYREPILQVRDIKAIHNRLEAKTKFGHLDVIGDYKNTSNPGRNKKIFYLLLFKFFFVVT